MQAQPTKSATAMRLAHKIHKQAAVQSFGYALRCAWMLVKHSHKRALAALSGKYRASVQAVPTMLGRTVAVVFKGTGFIGKVLRQDIRINPWGRW